MKKRVLIPIIVVLAIAVLGYVFVYPMLFIATGYAAKRLCSCHYIEGRSVENIIENDLGYGPLANTRSVLNEEERSTESTMFGLARQKAVYKDQLGCMLVHGEDSYGIEFPSVKTDYQTYVPWVADTLPNNRLQTVVDEAFDASLNMDSLSTRAVVVIHNGVLKAEKYANHFDKDTPILGWSMTKSVTSALIGMLVKDGELQLDQQNLFPEWTDERNSISLANLLHMQSGLAFDENYATNSDATEMLFRSEDMVQRAARMPLAEEPGSYWYYSSGTTNMLFGLIRNRFESTEDYLLFPYERLFGPLGMKSMVLETDESGNYVGSSYGFASALDWAKFGMLYLNEGNWNGEQLLDSSWVEFSRSPASNSGGKYGGQFWLNVDGSNYPDVPYDLFFCNGFEGQHVFIIPSENLVVVRMGLNNRDVNFDANYFLREVISALNAPANGS